VEPPGIGPLHLRATGWNKPEICSDIPDPMSTSTCIWWTACAFQMFNSQQERCEMRTIQDLGPTNVNMYRVASNRKSPKTIIKKKKKLCWSTCKKINCNKINIGR
jgi:hypothetical protein